MIQASEAEAQKTQVFKNYLEDLSSEMGNVLLLSGLAIPIGMILLYSTSCNTFFTASDLEKA